VAYGAAKLRSTLAPSPETDADLAALFDAVSVAAPKMLPSFKSQELANTAWAFATAGFAAPELFAAIAVEAAPRLRSRCAAEEALLPQEPVSEAWRPQEVSNVAWAFATARFRCDDLIDALSKAAVAHSADMNPQALANTAWALSTLLSLDEGDARLEFESSGPKAAFRALASSARSTINSFKARELSSLAWAFAKAHHGAALDGRDRKRLFDSIAASALRRMETFDAQGLSNVAWAFATAGEGKAVLFEALAKEALSFESGRASVSAADPPSTADRVMADFAAAPARRRLSAFNPQELANFAWAFSKADVEASALFQVLAEECVTAASYFNAQELANVAWAYSNAGIEAPKLYNAVASEAVVKIRLFKPKEVSSLAWAFSAKGIATPAEFGLYKAICSNPRRLRQTRTSDGGNRGVVQRPGGRRGVGREIRVLTA